MIKLDNLKFDINYNDNDIKEKIANLLKIDKNIIKNYIYLKKSLDCRKSPVYIISLAVTLKDKNIQKKYDNYEYKFYRLDYEKISSNIQPIVVGFGPSGMFLALTLAKMGLKPIVIEQGSDVDERQQQVIQFWEHGVLNKYSNVQFGEGGAGTFSDGKLNTNLNNDYCKIVLGELFLHGAPSEILYENKAHIGSDKLCQVVKNIRHEIIDLGGKILFNTKLVDIKNQKIEVFDIKNNKNYEINYQFLCLCVGHSARDTFKLLKNKNMIIKQKPFAMGVRIEQKAKDINLMQYKKLYDNLPNADYKLVEHLDNNRSVFTFCMCPGGYVVASSSDDNEIVTNGMSNFDRDNEYSNSALLVNVLESDYKSDDCLAGIYFQEKYEKLAFELGGGNFKAPAQTVGSFLYDLDNVGISTYRPNITLTQLKNCLPDFVYESLRKALKIFQQKYPNFAKNENMLIGIESRSSCPLTLLRDKNYESNLSGIYPVGEGAGYAGGIVSSAQDGIKVAESIYKKIKSLGV